MIDVIFSPGILVPLFLARFAMKRIFGLRLEVVVGVILYGLAQMGIRIIQKLLVVRRRWIYGRTIGTIERPSHPTSVTQINEKYSLKGMEVILGFGAGRRPIRVNLEQFHTLIAGGTGWGKSNLLTSIIFQFVQRGQAFFSEYDLFVFDLKAFDEDFFQLYRPVVTGYFTLDDDGTARAAIEKLEAIAKSAKNWDKRIVIVIDELAVLTTQMVDPDLKARGIAALTMLAAQLRAKGNLIVATQRPHHDIIGRNIGAMFDRRISFKLDDNSDTARLVFRYRPKTDMTQLQVGEFMMIDPRRRDETRGRTLRMNLPDEVERLVLRLVGIDLENNPKLKFISRLISGTSVGGRVPGINIMVKSYPDLKAEWISAANRNLVHAGVLDPIWKKDGGVAGYTLRVDYHQALGKATAFVKTGHWQETPAPLNNNGR